jgi:hypothetical protein
MTTQRGCMKRRSAFCELGYLNIRYVFKHLENVGVPLLRGHKTSGSAFFVLDVGISLRPQQSLHARIMTIAGSLNEKL